MKKITLEEFRKLSPNEQNKRYKELSDYDRYLARITAPISTQKVVDTKNKTLNKLVEIERKKFEKGEIDLIDMELLRNQAQKIDKGIK